MQLSLRKADFCFSIFLRSQLVVRLCKIRVLALPLPFLLRCDCLIQSDIRMPEGSMFMQQLPRPDKYCGVFLLKIAHGGVISPALTNSTRTIRITLSHLPWVHQHLITDAVVFNPKYSMEKARTHINKPILAILFKNKALNNDTVQQP